MAISLPRRRAIVFGSLLVLSGAFVLAAAFVLSGVYNVAASARHFQITDRLIKLTLSRSVDTHSPWVDVPNLDRDDWRLLGARHFANGCQVCHGAPGIRRNPIAQGMYPSAPSLEDKVGDWEDEELFWIVRHGLKFTGMPQWVGEGRDDEVWPLVAFLRSLPDLTGRTYERMVGASHSGSGFVLSPPNETGLVEQCSSCHGGAGEEPVSDLVPSLNGQKAEYLLRALEEYAGDSRQSGMMEPVAAALSPDQMQMLADAFAALPRQRQTSHDEPTEEAERIVLHGLPARDLPACVSCHGAGSATSYPELAGLSRTYVATQLRLFREGVRSETAHARIMQRIAGRLTEREIEEVARYIAERIDIGAARLSASVGGAP